MRTTEKQFWALLRKLRKGPGEWKLLPGGAVRRNTWTEYGRACDCPITAVYELLTGNRIGTASYDRAARRIGLGQTITNRITAAADYWSAYWDPDFDPKTRDRLLKTLGLDRPKRPKLSRNPGNV